MSLPVKKLLIVGNGMACVRLLEHLCEGKDGQSNHGYAITVLSEEPVPGYNRIMLSPLLAGELDVQGIRLKSADWYRENNIELLCGENFRVTALMRELKQVKTAGRQTFSYDVLVLATGSRPVMPDIPGIHLQGVKGFRTLSDVQDLLSSASQSALTQDGQAVVVGGGLLGLEAACALQKQGKRTTVVHSRSVLMNRQLDKQAGDLLADSLIGRGLSFELNARTVRLHSNGQNVSGVQLADGRTLPADLVVFTAGILPNIELMKTAGLSCDRGVLVNSCLQTSDSAIFALGECVQFKDQTFGLVEPVYQQAEILAKHLLNHSSSRFRPGLVATRLKVTGVDMFSLGDYLGEQGDDLRVLSCSTQGLYRKLVFKDHRLTGVLLYGDASDATWYQALLEQQRDITDCIDDLIFGQSVVGSLEAGAA